MESRLLRKGSEDFKASKAMLWANISQSCLRHRTPAACFGRWYTINTEAKLCATEIYYAEDKRLISSLHVTNSTALLVKRNDDLTNSCSQKRNELLKWSSKETTLLQDLVAKQ